LKTKGGLKKKMNVGELITSLKTEMNIEILNLPTPETTVTKPFCCDLLSVCMSKASIGCVWTTVMGNINAVAVAVLTDTALIILAENSNMDATALEKARVQNVNVIKTTSPVFETALKVYNAIEMVTANE
jgi:hypothetical protein